jgi:hypothetical protein
MTDKEAMKLALFALDIVKIHYTQSRHVNEAITALKERLAQDKALQALHNENERLGLYKDAYAEQEPVAWLSTDSIGERYLCFDKPLDNDPVQPLYTHPPQRTEQEPVAWMHKQGNYEEPSFRKLDDWEISNGWKQYPLYTTPPAQPAPVQDGWILVPVTLTNDMTSAMADALEDPNNERSSWDLAENMWQAMLPKVPTPPQRKPLTDEQIYDMYNEPRSDAEMIAFARAIEAAHGIKENT